jgi:SAM-dependent methyltransferase
VSQNHHSCSTAAAGVPRIVLRRAAGKLAGMHTPSAPASDDALQHWNERFSQPGYLFGREPNAFLVQQSARLAPRSRVLCVADGEGRNSTWLAARAHEVTAFDLSPVAVQKAQALAAAQGVPVEYLISGAGTWTWTEAKYDAVAAIFIQFAPPALRTALFAGMWQTLKPGGLLLIQGYTPKQLQYRTGGPGQLDHLYTPDLLRELLPEAQWLELREHDAVLGEGSAHRGPSALIDAVARKP